MRRELYTSNYSGMVGYLMDFGFGGFVGYGGGVPVELVKEGRSSGITEIRNYGLTESQRKQHQR